MNTLLLVLPGLIVGIGIAVIVSALLPRRLPQTAAALDRMGTTVSPEQSSSPTLSSTVGSWVHSHLPDLPGFTVPSRDLALVGESINRFYFTKSLTTAAGLALPALIGAYLQVLGVLPFYIPALLGIPLAILGWLIPDFELKAKADEARLEFKRAVAVYLELAATERHRGADASRSLETAAHVGKSWVFVRIRQELLRARYAGIQPWDALTTFSNEIGVDELSDIAKIVRIAGVEGGSIYDTLRARGKGLRMQLLSDEKAEANKLGERIGVPLSSLVLVLVGIVLTPMLMTLAGSA